ncbi:MAG: hydrolase [Candidatus Sericytochromatia bacterium]
MRSAGSKRIPMPAVIAHVKALKAQGAELYCWSSGGADYARRSAEEFGIGDCFSGFLPKPDVLIDDQEISTWPRLRCVHPSACSELLQDDAGLAE